MASPAGQLSLSAPGQLNILWIAPVLVAVLALICRAGAIQFT